MIISININFTTTVGNHMGNQSHKHRLKRTQEVNEIFYSFIYKEIYTFL